MVVVVDDELGMQLQPLHLSDVAYLLLQQPPIHFLPIHLSIHNPFIYYLLLIKLKYY